MRRRVVGIIGIFIAVSSAGCSGMSNTMKGGLAGGLIGGGVGTAVGSLSGNPGAGAIIGAGAGSLLGGVAGNDVDQEQKQQMEGRVIQAEATAAAAQARNQAPPLGITGVAQLAQQGFGDDVIINQIRSTNSTFNLSTSDLTWLKQSNVSDGVIAFMQTCQPSQTVIAPPRRVIVEQQPIFVQEPGPVFYARPYRPVYVSPRPSVGFTYIHRH